VARRRRPDDGRGGLPTVAVVAVVGLVLGVLAAPGYTLALQSDEGSPTTTTTPSQTTVTVTPGGTTVTTVEGGHDHGPTTTSDMATTVPTTMPEGTTTTMGDDPGHDEPGEHDDHDHETTTTTMPGEPHHDFPDDWTEEQVAFAEQLIADTEAALPRFANPAILPLLGYTWIFDGTTEGTYQHWINTSLIVQSEILNPEAPESLVFLHTDDGPVLQAAMYMLPLQYNMTNIPEDIAWLPDWHVHENLCFDNNFRIVGLTVNGVCEVGFNYITPPMLHVWTVDTPCGRFAGVDENGLQCHHEH
jgi:hypothetical protein